MDVCRYPLRARCRAGFQLVVLVAVLGGSWNEASAAESDVSALLDRYCLECHGGEKVKGKVDFTKMREDGRLLGDPGFWEMVAEVLEYGDMPPEENPQPSDADKEIFFEWFDERFGGPIQPQPGVFAPRRLSAPEYRHTLRSVFGFDLEVAIGLAEQTEAETSLVMKLIVTDPPGGSGFINDTHGAPFSTSLWDQYAYLSDKAIQELFTVRRREALAALMGQDLPENFHPREMTRDQGEALLRIFLPKAFRRPLAKEDLADRLAALEGKHGPALLAAVQGEMKAALMSPAFLYRGYLMPGESGSEIPVDAFELAERLSYFLWEDMPDAPLADAAATGRLSDPAVLTAQVDRMLTSPKARSLADSLGNQWFALDEIDHVEKDPTRKHALTSQPHDFLHYLFTENRPVMELIDSEVAFANIYTAPFYAKDRKQMVAYRKPKGIERAIVPNQRIRLERTPERGGLLTMPGILAMNKGPILRGTWILHNILGVHLGEPPPDVPPITATAGKKDLSFRERFELHRSDAACARCHNKIDPLGFALQGYDNTGKFIADQAKQAIDTSGRLPSGETFETFAELKEILVTSRRRDVIRTSVERTLAYALCRKLERYDRPTVEAITQKIDETDGTWRDLFVEVALSLPFQKTTLVNESDAP